MKLPACLFLFICAIPVLAQDAPLRPVARTIDGRNVDSMAIWVAPRREDSLVLLTEKSGNEVMVFRANRTADFVRRFGQFRRPNAIVVERGVRVGGKSLDLAFVTERDGNKVSVYTVPQFEKVGEFAHEIPQPMGISLYRVKDTLKAFVVAKRAQGDDKVVRFGISKRGGKVVGTRELSFGRELTPNQETVYVDRKTRTVFVADETAKNIKVYNLDGILQTTFGDGAFQAQVEGLALARCGGRRYLIASDQRDTTEFEVFDLEGFRHVGTVVTTAKHTDGIALTQERLPDYPDGLFIAQSDPGGTGGLRAEFFDLRELLRRALRRPPPC